MEENEIKQLKKDALWLLRHFWNILRIGDRGKFDKIKERLKKYE